MRPRVCPPLLLVAVLGLGMLSGSPAVAQVPALPTDILPLPGGGATGTPTPTVTPLPIDTPPSSNVTVPVGVPLNCGLTVVVNVTDWPNVDGFWELDTLVELVAWLTVWVSAAEVLESKFESPE